MSVKEQALDSEKQHKHLGNKAGNYSGPLPSIGEILHSYRVILMAMHDAEHDAVIFCMMMILLIMIVQVMLIMVFATVQLVKAGGDRLMELCISPKRHNSLLYTTVFV